eukprot:TRINITY_DN2362_c0_g1_i7.p1 TRINITY_DN2362_c0_g1~~TRINITY_DN2362_c0_g1_i7.p1  ORF type:complete len:279 (+),score=3.13 TRINITY_DN2362_c0_g1_i7:279-1115(+)
MGPKKIRKCCAVSTCTNPVGVSYHRFPQNVIERKEWIKRCKRDDAFNPDTSRVCECHFPPEAYEQDRINELLGHPTVKRLKKGSYPSINIPCYKVDEDTPPSKIARVEKIQNEEIEALLWIKIEEGSLEPENGSSSEPQEPVSDPKELTLPPQSDLFWKQKFNRLQSDHEKLLHSLKEARQDIRAAKKEIRKLKSKRFNNTMIKDMLSKIHSASKVKKLINPSSVHCKSYKKEDVTTALVLRSISNRAFEYLRSKNILPLPSRRTQERWLRDFSVTPE